jgi:glutathione S-transferase
VVQATQNRTAKDVSSALNGARYRRKGDRIIAESGAIIDYIVRRHGDGLRNLL